MLNRHSILFKLNIIFIITIISVTVIFLMLDGFIHKRSNFDLGFHLRHIDRNLHRDGEIEIKNLILPQTLEIVEDMSIVTKAKPIEKRDFFKQPPKVPFIKEHGKPPPPFFKREHSFDLLRYKDTIYVHIKEKNFELLLRYHEQEYKQIVLFIRVAYFVFLGILIIVYYMIRKNIQSLKTLQNSLKDYENGVVDATKVLDGKDEIALVSKQFYKVASKLEAVNESRKLFLRNMMHELKTPLTKSKLYLGFMEESKIKDGLELSLNKLELLIDDMANIEKITTDNVDIDKKDFRAIDIIDNAMDMLFINKNGVIIKDESTMVMSVDFKLFSIVLKNLIDNGIKYSADGMVFVECKDEKIYVSSRGERLEYNFVNYLEPFFKGDLNEINQRGFGLGLYIVNEILLKHRFEFLYEHKNDKNIFIIDTTA
ncbi:two-component sensor histidine kinase [Sulfurimonas gotlandica GD1]|uniref:histidine kinase n=1 Tax=Sulfurimonas gotlandica (strain DSM 19862 / JCM 16533 / GD1) TaxID=929558 RepID=B6BMY2_SULGG|nr:ArsS family sensor histidine kinase [Sulfurimonas gotlandica]EDZ61535.1 two-component system histidine kinase [Sulfurimonas gotlandica GD1]EHP30745.1 two-component sensor histidine kinase [Sulfurimonas gotlandica GD1]